MSQRPNIKEKQDVDNLTWQKIREAHRKGRANDRERKQTIKLLTNKIMA